MKTNRLLFGIVFLWLLFLFALFQLGWPSALVTFILSMWGTIQSIRQIKNPEKGAAAHRQYSKNYLILYKTFGPFTGFAMYGTLGILVVIAVISRLYPSVRMIRFSLGAVAVYLIFGLYLCYLVSKGEHSPHDGPHDTPS